MNRLVRHVFLAAAIMVSVAAIGFGARAVSVTLLKPPVPPVIAVVDLQAVVSGLDERTVKDAAYNSLGKELQAKIDLKTKELKDIKSQLDAAVDATERDNLQKRGILLQKDLEIEMQQSQQKLDNLYGESLAELYAKITAAAKKIAQQNGYTMVMASDENAEISKGDKRDVTRAITLKRMLYIDPNHYITQDVITLLNNEFRASGGTRIEPPAGNNGATPPTGNP
ncbi:MAG: OmpH family outer membrane protein [Phycisphaerales bacterium]